MTTLLLRNSISRAPLQRAFAVLPLALVLAWLALSPTAQAQACPTLCDSGDNTALGDGALISNNNNGANNTAIGFDALFSNTTGSDNTATGVNAMAHNTTGSTNTATGLAALTSNTTGSDNTATGVDALALNTTGGANTATGVNALENNVTGFQNTADGFQALLNNNGANNTATGFNALTSNTTGNNNTANGLQALSGNTTGIQNTATGVNALAFNTTGNNNTANGYFALQLNTGSSNTAYGALALQNNTTGSSNIALGFNAGSTLTTGNNNIDIGNVGVAGEAAKIRIGTAGTQTAAFIAGIPGVAVTGVAVHVSSSGQLGVRSSSARFKEAIRPMDKASEVILSLKPVTFRYKKELDPKGMPQFGLVAEQVAKVDPDLITRDAEGKPYSVRYEEVNAMLLNEFLKEHRKVEDLEATVAQQQKGFESKIARQQKQIAALTAGLQKVSAQVEMSRPTPQTVLNNQ